METKYIIALVLAGATVLYAFIKSRLATYDIIDGARWLTGIGKWRLLRRRSTGLIIDGRRSITAKLSRRHTAIICPSGTGKSSGVIIPATLGLKNCSGVITDLSGEIFEATAGRKAQEGFRISVLDVSNTDRSLSFNALNRADSHTEISKISETLVTAAFPEETGSNKFWNDSAQTVISILCRCLMSGDPQCAHLGSLYLLLNAFGPDGSGLDEFVSKHADQTTFAEFLGLRSNSPRALASIISTARTALKAFSDPKLCQISSTDTIRFETLRKRPTILYLTVPEHEIRFYSFWLNLLYSQIFNYAMQPPRNGEPYLPIFFLMDEIGNGSKIPGFSMYASTLRKRKCSLVLALQDTEQLVNIYGRSDASAILNGSISNKIYLPGLSPNMCQELERTLGKQTLEDRDTGQRFSRSLMTADEIRTMRDNRGIFISGNSPPAKLKMKPYFKRRKFKRYARIPPPEIMGSENSDPHYIDLRVDEPSAHPLPDPLNDIIQPNEKRETN